MEKPKKRIEVVYYLIQRMSRTEKRHFKMYNQIYKGKDKEFLKLFDFLNNLKKYNIVAIEAFWKKENIKQKGICTTYLLSKVLEAMYASGRHEMLTVKQLIQPHINNFHVYYKTQLLKLAYKELDKAEAIADKYEEIIELFKIYELKIYVGEIANFNKEICESNAVIARKRYDVLQKLIHQDRLAHIMGRMYLEESDDKAATTAYEELTAYKKHYDEFTVSDKTNFNVCHFLYYIRRQEHEKAFAFLTFAIELCDDNPHLIPHQLNAYFAIWHNVMKVGLHPNCIDLALKYYEKYKELPQKHKKIFSNLPINVEMSYYSSLHFFEMSYAIIFEKYDKIEGFCRGIKNTLECYADSLLREVFYLTLLYASYANLLIKNYTESEYWLGRLLSRTHLLSPAILDQIEILKLLLLYEQGNQSLIISNIRSLSRKWKITHPTAPNVLDILDLLQTIQLKRNQNELPKLFKTTYENMREREKETHSFLPFSKWIAGNM